MKKILLVLVLCFALFTAVACVTIDPPGPGPEPEPEVKAPVITVTPEAIEMNAGEEIDLLFGVSATDEVDGTVTVIVSDDGNFDADVPGTYTITYRAENSSGKEAKATRTITVGAALSNLALEVKENKLGEAKWPGKQITFKNALYVELTADAELAKQSGVFHNGTTEAIKLSVEGVYGCAAVLDTNGRVVEGRDGANSKLVNEKNPTRAGSTVTKLDEETTVSSAFAKDLVIPAGGYAVVIQQNYAGTTADTDGRGFMNYNVIAEYGNVVRLLWVDTEEVITPYVNQAPVVSGNTTVYVAIGNASADVEAMVKAGLTAKDDNGTFAIDDDVNITEFSVENNGGFNINTAGEYTFTLKVSDGEKEATFKRVVSVLPADNCATIKIGENSHIVLNTAVAIDKDLTGVGTYSYIIYTPAYKLPDGQTDLGYTNGYGEAFLLNEFGEIVIIYDGANGRKFTEAHHTLKPTDDTERCTPDTYLADAFAEAKEKGLYVVIAANSTANNAAGGSRKFLLDNRTWGEVMSITGITFKQKQITFAINGKEFNAAPELVLFNEVTDSAAKFKMLVYRNCTEETIKCNGYGIAIVLDKYGKLNRIYDGATAKFFDAENPTGKTGAGFNGNDYAIVAYAQLQEGETLIIFPNDGVNAADSARTFASGLRMDGSIGKVATLTDVEFQEEKLEITINGKKFTAYAGQFLINTVTESAAKFKMLVYRNCTEETIKCNGFGIAIVLDKYGKLNRIYDGATAKFFDAENPSGKTGAGFNGNDYAIVAYAQLQEGETLIIFPNDGVNAADSARTFASGLRMDGSIGKVATLTDIEFQEEKVSAVTLNGKTFDKANVTFAINDAKATNTSADFLVFTSQFTGTIAMANGYGEAFVIKDGKVVRIYDGASGKYYDADNTAGVVDATKCTAANYLKEAIASLDANEYVLCAPHDGGANLARGFLYNNKVIGADFEQTYVTIETSNEKCNAFIINGNYFFGAKVAINEYPATPANIDFVVYSYGYTGRVFKNGWCEVVIINVATGKTVKVFDGMTGKYFDAENTAGIVDATITTAANALYDAFNALQPGEILVAGINGGRNSNAGRAFINANRVIDKTAEVRNITIPTPEATFVKNEALVVDGEMYMLAEAIKENEAASATDAFLIIRYGFNGTVPANGHGEALVIKDGKVVRIYDGANGKYYDAENPAGIVDATKCAADTYLAQAVASLTEGEYVLCAPHGGTTGNVARAFLLAHRKIGIAVVLPKFEA